MINWPHKSFKRALLSFVHRTVIKHTIFVTTCHQKFDPTTRNSLPFFILSLKGNPFFWKIVHLCLLSRINHVNFAEKFAERSQIPIQTNTTEKSPNNGASFCPSIVGKFVTFIFWDISVVYSFSHGSIAAQVCTLISALFSTAFFFLTKRPRLFTFLPFFVFPPHAAVQIGKCMKNE